MMDVLKVAAKSNPNSVAGALAGVIREKGKAEMQAIGAGALNQAIKAGSDSQRICCSYTTHCTTNLRQLDTQ